MNLRLSRSKNPLRGSQLIAGKENFYGGRYRVSLKNIIGGVRPSSRDNRAFRNITNLHPKVSRGHDEIALKKFQRPRIENKNINSKSVISCSFTTRQIEANTSVNLVDSRKKYTETAPKVNPQECEEYMKEIISHTQSMENKFKINPDYMSNQMDINNTMRSILIDWLVDVNIRFKLLPETLFLTVNIIDRYLQKQQVKKCSLQLVGVTAALIASKYEEIYPPEVKDFVYITDYAYTKDEILLMEQKILNTLEFNVTVPSSNRFLEYFVNTVIPNKGNKKTICLAQYLLELSLINFKMLNYQPSLTATTALYIAKKLQNEIERPDKSIEETTGYTKNNLMECTKEMIEMLRNAPESSLQAVRRKFSSMKYMEVGRIKLSKKNR